MKLTVAHDSSGKTTAIGNSYPAGKNIPEAANAADITEFVS